MSKKKNMTKDTIKIFINIHLVFFIAFSSPLEANMLYQAKNNANTDTIPITHPNILAKSKTSALALVAKLAD